MLWSPIGLLSAVTSSVALDLFRNLSLTQNGNYNSILLIDSLGEMNKVLKKARPTDTQIVVVILTTVLLIEMLL